MKKIFMAGLGLILLGACTGKQSVDDNYYKRTRGVAWSGPQATSVSDTSLYDSPNTYDGYSAGYGSSVNADPELNWQDPAAPNRAVPIPDMPEKKLQCVKTDRNAYTCRIGQYQCGTGCQADGSNCYSGYCLQSDCDDVMGQKWDLVYRRSDNLYVCQHPSAKVSCRPNGTIGGHQDIRCYDAGGSYCGYDCNKNGTQCANGPDTCWSKYRNVR